MKHARASWLLLLCGGSAFAHHGNSEFDLTALTGTAELSYRPDLAPADIACDRESAQRFFREFQ